MPHSIEDRRHQEVQGGSFAADNQQIDRHPGIRHDTGKRLERGRIKFRAKGREQPQRPRNLAGSVGESVEKQTSTADLAIPVFLILEANHLVAPRF